MPGDLLLFFYINYLGTNWSILFNLFIILVGNIFILLIINKHEWTLCLSTGIIGAGVSPVWGCVFGYIRQYIPMSSRVAATFIISCLVGEFVFPALTAKFITCNPISFTWITHGCSLIIFILFILIEVICRAKLKKQ